MRKIKIKGLYLILLAIILAGFLFCNVKAMDKTEVQIEMDGYGTEEYPYLITCTDDLENIRDVLNSENSLQGKWFALVNDLDFKGERIEPLADQTSGESFWGGFDGRGHTISNFVIQTDSEPVSFFGRIDGVVQNVILDGEISGSSAASFAMQGDGLVLNCISKCDIKAVEQAAGIVNNWNGALQNVVFSGNIGANSVSGIVSGGNGTASSIYSYDIPVGTIQNLTEDSIITVGTQSHIVDVLNESAKKCFLMSDYGKCLNTWISSDGEISFSEEVVSFAGTGIEKNPYVIDSAEKLQMVITYLNYGYSFDGEYLFQTEDIDLSDTSWNFFSQDAVPFMGIYNGNGHTITGLNTGTEAGGLFNNFDGTILNLGLIDCHTMVGCGFAGYMGSSARIINSYCFGEVGDINSLITLIQFEQVVNCYISGVIEPAVEELNLGLNNIVVNYGVHCGDLFLWSGTEKLGFGDNYKETYFRDERSYWAGAGVEKNPYLINNLEDFVYLRESVHYNESFWRYWFLQTADIDFSSVKCWKAISDESAVSSFKGIYNGNGFQMLGFQQENTSATHSGTIFGNLGGTIMNIHITDCKIQGMGNGVLAFIASDTAKIINNVIQIGNSNVLTTLSIVYSNSGKVLNNIVVLPDISISFKVAGNVITEKDSELEPEQEYNQILLNVTLDEVQKYNENTQLTARHIKQRITNFNFLSRDQNELSLHNPISARSGTGIKYYFSMLKDNIILLGAVLWSVGCIVIGAIVLFRKLLKRNFFQTAEIVQINISLGVYLLFVLAIQFSRQDVVWGKVVWLGTVVAILLFVGNTIWLIRRAGNLKKNKLCFDIKKYTFVIATFAVTVVISILHFSIPVAYDADLYYGSFIQAIENFSFTVTGVLESFCIASKPMHGIAMLMEIGEALSPGTGIGIYIVNVVLLLAAQFSVYKIIQKLFPAFSLFMCAEIALCFSFSGYVIAGATYINPDFYSVVTFTIFIYCWLYGYKIMSLYWGFMVLCSKPNMILAYFVFLTVFCLIDLKQRKFKLCKWIPYTVPITIYLFLYFGINSLNRAGIPAESGNAIIVTTGSRLLQYFAYGFIWIQEIFIIWSLIYLIKNKKLHIFSSVRGVFLFGTWLACFTQLLISLIGGSVLQLCPRYLAVCAIKNILLFAMAIDILPQLKHMRQIVVSMFLCLLFIQLFKTIDPAIISTTEYKYDNLYYLVFPRTKSTGNDLTFYNYEYAKDARTGSKILSELNSQEIANLYSDGRSGYKMAIGSSGIYAAYWDTVRNCRTYIRNDDCVRLKMTMITGGLNTCDVNNLEEMTIIVRSSKESPFLTKIIVKEWKKEEYDSFLVYKKK